VRIFAINSNVAQAVYMADKRANCLWQ